MAAAAHSEKISLVKNRPTLTAPDDLMDVNASMSCVGGEPIMLRENWARLTMRPLLEKSFHQGSTLLILLGYFGRAIIEFTSSLERRFLLQGFFCL